MLRKLVVVYDAGAASIATIKKEIIEPARKMTGMLVGKFVWQPVGFNENARRLAQFLHDGDLVVVAGGDGLASMAMNAILRAQREVTLAVIGYGLTNDISGLTRVRRPVLYGDEYVGGIEEIIRKADEGKTLEVFPLKIRVNGRPWRYALAHASVGMMAAGLASLDEGKRKKSLTGAKWRIFGWWLSHKQLEWLPEATLKQLPANANAEEIETTDHEENVLVPDGEVEKKDFDAPEVVSGEEAAVSGEEVVTTGEEAISDGKKDSGEESSSADDVSATEVASPEPISVEAASSEIVAGETVSLGDVSAETASPEEWKYEVMILGELSGRNLRVSRGLAGVRERISRLGWKFYNWRHGRTMACAVEFDSDEVTVSLPEQSATHTEVDAGRLLSPRVTDLVVVNGRTMARKWHGGRFYKRPEGFLVKTGRFGSLNGELGWSLAGRIWRIPGKKVKGKIELRFLEPQDVYLQTDNAWQKLTGVETIEISKSQRGVRVVR